MLRPVSHRGTGSEPATDRAGGLRAPTEAVTILRTVDALRAALLPARRAGKTIGLVPTMGALHDGHLSLIARARQECDVVVVSVFVNPTQFDEQSDLDAYPRSESRDAELAGGAGAALLFAPAVAEIYPQGHTTSVHVGAVTEALEGEVRGAGHFTGVATVVLKLLNIAAPDIAYFGQKDAQQVVVIRRLVRDLNLAVQIATCETVREADGLALSSRNARLSPSERLRAVALHRGLAAAQARATGGVSDPAQLLDSARAAMAEFDVVPEYLELVDEDTLEPLQALDRGGLLVVAARLGQTRLIDNATIQPADALRSTHATGRETELCSA